ncbi:Paxneb family protein [Salix suchowensis]|nr:Paxneb family protein [Salix suchowensis]
MAATKTRISSFSRNNISCVCWSIAWNKRLGGEFTLGSLVMIMEGAEAPHHMLLLRNFIGFLGTLPSPSQAKDDKSRHHDTEQEKGLRIAWQYKKYFVEKSANKQDFCNDLACGNHWRGIFFSAQRVDCVSTKDSPNLNALHDRCATFFAQFAGFP